MFDLIQIKKHFVGIELTSNDNYNLLFVKRVKKNLLIEREVCTHDINKVVEICAKSIPVSVVVNNEQIITKQIERFNNANHLTNAFPNIKAADFYYEAYSNNDQTFISICRKDYIDDLILKFEKLKINVVSVNLGNLVVSQLGNYISGEVFSSNASITFKENKITNITNTSVDSKEYLINDLKVNNTSILSFASILSIVTGTISEDTNLSDFTNSLRDDFNQRQFFTLGSRFFLGLIFSLLLISFLFFSNYSDGVNALTSTLEVSKTQKKNLIKLKEDIGRKKQLLQEISNGSSKASWYLDQIGSSVPVSIKLSALNWQPLNKTIKENQPLYLTENQIIIKGVSTDAKVFSQWTEALEQSDWVKSITVNEYGVGKKTQTVFELQLLIQ